MKRVLFLCTGNYYRSRFAEILFNRHAEERGIAWRAESRGLELDARNPGPISRHTLAALRQMEICCDAYMRLPMPVTADDFRSADHVVAVKEAEHRALMKKHFPDWLEHVEFWHVHDVDCAGPEIALPELQAKVLTLIDQLAKRQPQPVKLRA